MRLKFKIAIFIIVYTAIFYLVRTSIYNYRLFESNIDSIPWLYSVIGSIFGIISAFIIQKEWQKWNDLVDAVKGESGALRALWSWAGHLPETNKNELRSSVVEYLTIIIAEGWKKTENGEISEELENAVRTMGDAVSNLSEVQPKLATIAFSFFNNIVNYREKRLRYGSDHMPKILLAILRLATTLMIVLCPLIAIKSYELQYIFNISIAVLSYSIYLVACDLDSPLRPGGWHLTTSDYVRLREKLTATVVDSSPQTATIRS